MPILLLVATSAAFAGTTSLGFAAAVSTDLPSRDPLEDTAFGPGATLVVPLRWTPRPGASLRVGLEVGAAAGHDTVVWDETAGDATTYYYSVDHDAGYGAARLLVGPEVALFPARVVSPYLGVGGGAALVMNWHRFSADVDALGVPTASTMQAAGAVGADVGVHIGKPGGLAFEVELGYTVSFLPAASLQQAPAELDASRSAYALDVVRGGLGVSIPL